MLCRMLLERLPNHIETVYLATPSLSRQEILHAIAHELGITLPSSQTHQAMRALQERLLEIYATGRRVVVLIDEAHAMAEETLEEIRLLSNLESNRHKLLHIVLFGQPELDERLSAKSMRQLQDRITHHFFLAPLRPNEINNYLMFRLRTAGYRGPDLFTPSALRVIGKASGGLTRRLNVLADKSLLAAFAEGQHGITRRHVCAAVRDLQCSAKAGKISQHGTKLIAATAAVLLGMVFFAWRHPLPEGQAQATTPEQPQALPSTPALATPPEPNETRGAGEDRSETSSKQPLADHIAATEEWIRATPGNHYFIQLFSTYGTNQNEVQHFIEHAAGILDPRQIRVYRSNLSGRDRLGVIYGDFSTREGANAELAKLNGTNLAGAPYIRAVEKLK